jgi:SIR2-like domain
VAVATSRAEGEAIADGLPNWLIRFVTALHFCRATVITFNYDRLIERAMQSAEIDDFEKALGEGRITWLNMLRSVPTFPPIPARTSGELNPSIQLLKLHGSLNWFWVTGDASGVTLSHWKLDDDNEGRHRYLPGREPFVVPPAASKSAFFRNPIMSDIWRRSAMALREAKRVALVGYSLPLTDLVSASMVSETLSRSDVEIEVVNPYPAEVVTAVQRLTGRHAASIAAVEEFADRYVESASRRLGTQCRQKGTAAPDGALLLVGWNREFLARVTGIARADGRLELTVDDFHLPATTALQAPGAPGLDPVAFVDFVLALRQDDVVTAVFANGSRATLVGIDRFRTETGLTADWQVLIPAESPTSLELTSWNSRHGIRHEDSLGL